MDVSMATLNMSKIMLVSMVTIVIINQLTEMISGRDYGCVHGYYLGGTMDVPIVTVTGN